MAASSPLPPKVKPPLGVASSAAWFETLVLVASAALALLGTHALGSEAASKWLIGWAFSVPLLVGIKHGLLPSMFAGSVVFLALPGARLHPDPAGAVSILLALVAGQVTESRQRRLHAVEQRLAGDAAATERLFRDREVTRVSHSLLEERVAASGWSLQTSVEEAERAMLGQPIDAAARVLLELLESQASVRASAFYLATGSQPAGKPVATLGEVARTSAGDMLMHSALSRRLVIASGEGGDSGERCSGDALLAVPVVTTHGQAIGVVTVHDLPFVAFHQAQFNLIATLVSRFADLLSAEVRVTPRPTWVGVQAAPHLPPLRPGTTLQGLQPLGASRRQEGSGVHTQPEPTHAVWRPNRHPQLAGS